jgi:hypothetical protein
MVQRLLREKGMKTQSKKLLLKKETVKDLTAQEMGQAGGNSPLQFEAVQMNYMYVYYGASPVGQSAGHGPASTVATSIVSGHL